MSVTCSGTRKKQINILFFFIKEKKKKKPILHPKKEIKEKETYVIHHFCI